ncbi:MAG: membrane protein insertion efficiency factor YidD [Myxococcota bacterium]
MTLGLVLTLAITGAAHAAPREPVAIAEPWEPVPRGAHVPGDEPRFAPFGDLALAAVRLYRARIAPRSIARCPFVVSCSTLALRSVESEGLFLGLLRFIDRFFFRETPAALSLYRSVYLPDGALRLDDGAPPP